MQQYIGRCKLCGGHVEWDYENETCIFHPVDGCLCECPYPANFMDWWKDYGNADIEVCFDAWEGRSRVLMEAIEELYNID